MDAATLADLDDLDFDLGSLDGFECFDFEFDLPDYLPDFCGDGGCLLPAVADKNGGLGLSSGPRDGDGGDGGRESSPDSVVTDDGATPRSSGDRYDGEMSAYVSDLERFLLEDDEEAGGLFAAKDLATNDHFFNDLVIIPYVEPSTAPEEFAVTDHFFGDLGDGYTEPATPGKDLVAEEYFFSDLAYIVPSTAGEDPVSDDYFYDVAVVDDGCPANVDAASSATEYEDAAAGEYDDEASSRKRARYE